MVDESQASFDHGFPGEPPALLENLTRSPSGWPRLGKLPDGGEEEVEVELEGVAVRVGPP